jgi:hypothetical protein
MRSNTFEDIDLPDEDQWYYHAVADIILAHSLLRSFPEVDRDRIGLTGISWGGILASTTAGVDQRFKVVIPVYGCAYVNQMPVFKRRWERLGPDRLHKWMTTWDPATYLPRARMPMLWLNGSNDPHFPLNTYARSCALVSSPQTLSIHVGMYHGHIPGWEPEEIYAFTENVLGHGPPLARVDEQGMADGKCWAVYRATEPIARAELVYTTDVSDWVKCSWERQDAMIDAHASRVNAPCPEDSQAWFFNLIDKRGLLTSSRLHTVPD